MIPFAVKENGGSFFVDPFLVKIQKHSISVALRIWNQMLAIAMFVRRCADIHKGIIVRSVSAPVQVPIHTYIWHFRFRTRIFCNPEAGCEVKCTSRCPPVSFSFLVNAILPHIAWWPELDFPFTVLLDIEHDIRFWAAQIFYKEQLIGLLIRFILCEDPVPAVVFCRLSLHKRSCRQ